MKNNPLLTVLRLADSGFTAFVFGVVVRALGETGIQLVFVFLLRDVFAAMIASDLALLLLSLQRSGLLFLASLTVFLAGFLLLQRKLAEVTAKVRQTIFEKLHALPISYFKTHHSGDVLSRMTNDVNATVALLGEMPSKLLFEILTCLASGFIIFSVDMRLGLVAVLSGILGVVANTLAARKLRTISRDLQESQAKLTTVMTDLFAGVQVVKGFSLYGLMDKMFAGHSQKVRTLGLSRVETHAALEAANFTTSTLNVMGLLVVGSFLALRGEISVPDIVMVTQAQNGIERFFSAIGTHLTGIQTSLAAAERVVALVEETEEPLRYAGMLEIAGEPLCLKDVEFGYDREERVLSGVSLTAREGEMVALVGPSGGGKSTLLKLMLGFYEPQAGSIFINGQSLSQQTLSEARSLFSYVPQDAMLFSGTVADNIRMGKLDATPDEVVQAAKVANAHDFIVALEKGYETLVGEKGAQVSGGQRQRIAIARAVIRNAPILLLDEATASLDSESEGLVQEALSRLIEDRTVIVVAHRLSTVEKADKIVVVAEGKVVEEGSHNELLARGGLYRQLHDQHLSGQAAVAS
ncbi:MAG: ABC transporter ATP-binding protein [Thermaerobacter sp.]|nr:ABC transporter ATP-binding protein [Thermaerobacter sp.]